MDNKKQDYNTQLADLIQKNIKNAESMASLLLSPEYEADLMKNLTPEQKAEFLKAKNGVDYTSARADMEAKFKELQNLKNKGAK